MANATKSKHALVVVGDHTVDDPAASVNLFKNDARMASCLAQKYGYVVDLITPSSVKEVLDATHVLLKKNADCLIVFVGHGVQPEGDSRPFASSARDEKEGAWLLYGGNEWVSVSTLFDVFSEYSNNGNTLEVQIFACFSEHWEQKALEHANSPFGRSMKMLPVKVKQYAIHEKDEISQRVAALTAKQQYGYRNKRAITYFHIGRECVGHVNLIAEFQAAGLMTST